MVIDINIRYDKALLWLKTLKLYEAVLRFIVELTWFNRIFGNFQNTESIQDYSRLFQYIFIVKHVVIFKYKQIKRAFQIAPRVLKRR